MSGGESLHEGGHESGEMVAVDVGTVKRMVAV
jgi:hypothetical protein